MPGPSILLALVLALACLEPHEPRPGFRLTGEVVEGPVDWAFTADVPKLFVETRTWYWLPHSIEANLATYRGALYVPSIYYEGGRFPEGRSWNRNIVRDPHVRLKIGPKLYPRLAVLATDPAEVQGAFEALAAKYPNWQELLAKPPAERPPLYFIRMDAIP